MMKGKSYQRTKGFFISLVFRLGCILGLFSFPSLDSEAQDYVVSLKRFGTEDGLIHREVRSIYQDSRGFMWFATSRGINRFDGYEFKTWTRENGLFSDDLTIAAEDSEGYLWLLSSGYYTVTAITFLHITSGEVLSFSERFGPDAPFRPEDLSAEILRDKNEYLYFVDHVNHKLFSYHDSIGFKSVELETESKIELLNISHSGGIWADIIRPIETNYIKQIEDFRPSDFKDTLFEISLEGKVVRRIDRESFLSKRRSFNKGSEYWSQESLYSGTGGILALDSVGRTRNIPLQNREFSNADEVINFTIFDFLPENEIIIGVDFKSIQLIELEKNRSMRLNEIFPELNADKLIGRRAYYRDKDDRIWLSGDFGVYLLTVKKNPFERYLYTELGSQLEQKIGISCRQIIRFKDKLYVSTEHRGILELDTLITKETKPAIPFEKNPRPSCRSVYLADDQKMYMGCYPYLYRYDSRTGLSEILREEQNKNLGIWTSYEDRGGNLWLGDDLYGLFCKRATQDYITPFEKYNGFDELRKATVQLISEDNQGNIWICASTGFYLFDPEEGIKSRYWAEASDKHKLPLFDAISFYQDKEGIYWIATAGQGLIRWDRERNESKQFKIQQGLSSNVLYAIYEDDYQNLWISSDNGIIWFNKISMQAYPFLVKDGITHAEFNRNSHFKDSDGSIYFGGLNGVTRVQPEFWKERPLFNQSPFVVTSFLQFANNNEVIDRTFELTNSEEIIIHPGEGMHQLSFALLSFEDTRKVRYSYIIERLDESWNEQYENYLRLGHLPYGRHTLRINAYSENGMRCINELKFRINVIRPIYMRYWFFLLISVMILCLIYGIYRFNLNREMLKSEASRIREQHSFRNKLYSYISHELRTPLTVIMGMARNLKGSSRERELILRNGENLLQLVSQMLNLSKFDDYQSSENLIRGDIVFYIQYLLESFHSMAHDKNLKISFDSEESEIIMDFDETKIQQIMYNLISNAIKFTPEEGSIMILLRRTSIDQKDFVQIRVRDSGIGLSSYDKERIFDHFYQVNGTEKMESEGSGLGLALIREIVLSLNGSIEVESEAGEGSVFTVLLPTKRIKWQAVKSNEENAENRFGNNNLNFETEEENLNEEQTSLLIIEDNRDVSEYIQSIIESDFHLQFATNGAEGLKIAFDTIPDIIISDVLMPDMNGYEVTKLLKKDPRTCHIPVILLTAKVSLEDRMQGINAGADAYLTKPFHKKELNLTLRKLLDLRLQLQRHYRQVRESTDVTSNGDATDDQLIHELRKLVKNNIDNTDLNISDLCKGLGLSQAQLYRKTKTLTGMTPNTIVRAIRLQHALNLLKSGELNVSEVAYKSGFSDPNYFSRVFSQEYGRSPNSYLKST